MAALRFSVIIPAYNVQGYLRQAVASVAGYADAEVIVVDDRSTDDTAVLADELAELFDTVRVVRPDTNSGLGEARNLGMDHATGDYLLFLDGDDYFIDGALDEIRAAIDGVEPDVVQFGYARLYPNGDRQEGIKREPLQGESPFTAAERPAIFTVLNVAWNKAYRREFVQNTGLRFPTGYYEDIPWTYPILAMAESIVGLDRPLYMYRQRMSGSILRSTGRKHLEIADQFERLMDIVEASDIPAPVRAEVFECAYRNLATLLTHQRGRIPAGERRAFYERVRNLAREHAPEGYVPPTSGDQFQAMGWIWTLHYFGFQAHVRSRSAYRTVRGTAEKSTRRATGVARRVYHHGANYRVFRKTLRIEPDLVVMENLWGRTPRLNCKAVADELQRSHPDKRIVWLVQATEAADMPEGVDYAVWGTRKYFRALATARYLFTDTNFPGWWSSRSGQTVTQLHHGTPLKLMGVEERGKDREWRDRLLKRCQQWDFSVVSNPYSAEVWKHSYPVRCETLELGYPRNDVLVNATDESKAAARAELGLAADARVLLYAPTFREHGAGVSAGLDIRELEGMLDANDVVLVRGHYFYGGKQSDMSADHIIDVSSYPSVETLYLAADILVTDYSSAMFDYANLRRPIIVFPYDWEFYSRERGTYFDITQDAPGAVVWTTGELGDALRTRAYESPENAERLARFVEIFTKFDSGTASKDVVARVVDGESIPPRDPDARAVPALRTWQTTRIG